MPRIIVSKAGLYKTQQLRTIIDLTMIVEFETPVRGKSTTAAMTTVNSA